MTFKKLFFKVLSFSYIIFIFAGCSENEISPDEKSENDKAVIQYYGELISNRVIRFDGFQSTNAEYYEWSYKESSQSDENYFAVNNNNEYSSVSLCFQKAADYDIKLEIKEGITEIITVTISQNNSITDTDKSYIKIHNNLDGTYSLTLTLSDQIHNIITDMNNKYIYFDFIGWDDFNSHVTPKYCYYQYLIEGYTDSEGTYDPGFYLKENPADNVIPFYEHTAPDNLPKDILLDSCYTLTIDNVRDLAYYDMLIIKRDSSDTFSTAYLKIFGKIALTDDTMTDYYIQEDPL